MGTLTYWAPTDTVSSGTIAAPGTLSDDNAATAASSAARSSCSITVTAFNAWIRLMPAATEPTVRKGTLVKAGETWVLPTSWWRALYSGEISIINAADGQSPVYYVTEL